MDIVNLPLSQALAIRAANRHLLYEELPTYLELVELLYESHRLATQGTARLVTQVRRDGEGSNEELEAALKHHERSRNALRALRVL